MAITRKTRSVLGSLSLHALAIALLLVLHLHAPVLTTLRMPGTPQGTHVLLTYSVGGQQQTGDSHTPTTKSQPAPKRTPAISAPTPPPPAPRTESEAGSGTLGDSALGDGDLRAALPQFHPRPSPDLSILPPGTSGNVVVDITIDSTGRVTQAHLVKGLGSSIDKTVLATLQTWTFTPATRNGQVTATEEEVMVHFDRGWSAPHIAPSPS